ncbi:hypothetical protein SDC9_152800 [bioreactor metagenome]|uniref:Uncharacterized protein n=1 Tax=bioreactor metagenome TaxID=1076179 RepID=A0A645EWG6_9ZZZZ
MEQCHRHAPRPGEILVVGEGGNFAAPEHPDEQGHRQQPRHEQQVLPGHGKDAAEEVAHKIRTVARGEVCEDDPRRHARGPDDADDGIRPGGLLQHDPGHEQGQGQGEPHGAQPGGKPEEKGESHPAIGRVGHTPGEDHVPLHHHHGPKDAAQAAAEQGGPEGVPHELELQQVSHGCTPPRRDHGRGRGRPAPGGGFRGPRAPRDTFPRPAPWHRDRSPPSRGKTPSG